MDFDPTIFQGLVFFLVGKIDQSRIKQLAKARGAKISESLSRTTHVLTTANPVEQQSKKFDKAVDCGRLIIDIAWFYECVRQNRRLPPDGFVIVPENAFAVKLRPDESPVASLSRSVPSPLPSEASSPEPRPTKRRCLDRSLLVPSVTPMDADAGFEDRRPGQRPVWGLRPALSPPRPRPGGGTAPATRGTPVDMANQKLETPAIDIVTQKLVHTARPARDPRPVLHTPRPGDRPARSAPPAPVAPAPTSGPQRAKCESRPAKAAEGAAPQGHLDSKQVELPPTITLRHPTRPTTAAVPGPTPADPRPGAPRPPHVTRPPPPEPAVSRPAASLAHSETPTVVPGKVPPKDEPEPHRQSAAQGRRTSFSAGGILNNFFNFVRNGGSADPNSASAHPSQPPMPPAQPPPPPPPSPPRPDPHQAGGASEAPGPKGLAGKPRPAAPTRFFVPLKDATAGSPVATAPGVAPTAPAAALANSSHNANRQRPNPVAVGRPQMLKKPGPGPQVGSPARRGAGSVGSRALDESFCRERGPAANPHRPPWNADTSVCQSPAAGSAGSSERSTSEQSHSPSRPPAVTRAVRVVDPRRPLPSLRGPAKFAPNKRPRSPPASAKRAVSPRRPRPNLQTPQPPARRFVPAPPSRRASQGPLKPPVPPRPHGPPAAAKRQEKGKEEDEADEHPLARRVRRSEHVKGKVDDGLVKQILREVLDTAQGVGWDDISGLENAKAILRESIILPCKRPELFTGVRAPPKGVLLFGPPGNGKTLLARAVASQCQSTFFNISASSLTSKFMGEGEKLVRAMFAVARALQPSVVFIDEVDSLLTARSANEHDALRRMKTEFLVQMDGVGTGDDERVLVLAATNRPHELDDAALRRFTKRVYIPMPDSQTRRTIVQNKMGNQLSFSDKDWITFMEKTEGYSGSDLKNLVSDMALQPVRELGDAAMHVPINEIRPVLLRDFFEGVKNIRPSVSRELMATMERWNANFGSSA